MATGPAVHRLAVTGCKGNGQAQGVLVGAAEASHPLGSSGTDVDPP